MLCSLSILNLFFASLLGNLERLSLMLLRKFRTTKDKVVIKPKRVGCPNATIKKDIKCFSCKKTGHMKRDSLNTNLGNHFDIGNKMVNLFLNYKIVGEFKLVDYLYSLCLASNNEYSCMNVENTMSKKSLVKKSLLCCGIKDWVTFLMNELIG